VKVRFSPTARRQIGALAAWWKHLFYRVDVAAETIWIVGAWSALRGSGPELP
jgi:hypothetical protein